MSVKFDLKQFKKNARARFLITMPILKFSSLHLFKKKKIIKQYLCNNIELSMKPKCSKGRELTLQEDPCICRNNFLFNLIFELKFKSARAEKRAGKQTIY